MVLGSRGKRSVAMRATAGVALAATLSGPVQATVLATAAVSNAPSGATGATAPRGASLPTDALGAPSARIRPEKIVPLDGGVGSTELETLFDDRAGTGLEAARGPVRFRLDFGRDVAVEAVGIFGRAQGVLAVAADGKDGPAEPTTIDATKGSADGRWSRFAIKGPASAKTQSIVVSWTPAGQDAVLRELEVWGRADGAGGGAAVELPDALYTGTPAGAVEARARQDEQTIAPSRPTATFTVKLDHDPRALDRAFLVYELDGLPHFTAAARTINGRRVAGRFGVSLGAKGGIQVEEISPSWLTSGTNRIDFLPVDDHSPASYRVSALRLVGIPGSGARLDDGGAKAWTALRDGREGTGWQAAVKKAGASTAAMKEWTFAAPAQPRTLDFRLPARGAGTLTIGAGEATSKGRVAVALDDLAPGWHQVALDRLPVTDRLTLSLAGGKEQGAALSELAVTGSPLPADAAPRLAVTYPLSGECVNHRVHVRGFVDPAQGATLAVNGARADGALASDGAFAVELAERDLRAASGTGKPMGVTIEAAYAGGARVRRTVPIGACVGRPTIVVADDGRPRQPKEDLGAPYGVTVKAGQAARLAFAGVDLDIPAGAVENDVRITIRPLPTAHVAPVDSGMTNITPGAQAFRMGPLGMVFKKPIRMTVPYDRKLIPAGYTEGEVRTFYYDETMRHWEQVALVGQEEGSMQAVTNHFTDFINATIAMPDHPGTQSFNPTSLKDIKLADPSAGISLIEPPAVNSMGTANMRLAIEAPAGRRGIQPELAITYSSEGQNGWLGVGWDLKVSSIQVDTRFGVPRYDAFHDQTYLLDGEMLTAVAPPPGAPPGVYFDRRVKGRFDWIQRTGNGPGDFTWVVTDKNGVKYFYGESSGGRLSDPDSARTPNIFRWYLERVQDPFGNVMRLSYATDSVTRGGALLTQLYPAHIDYTSGPGLAAPYHVDFTTSDPVAQPRQDDIIDGRPGFGVITRRLLQRIDVRFQTTDIIRSYLLSYKTGDLGKTLLDKIDVTGLGGATVLYTHQFDYNTVPRSATDPQELAIFAPPVPWGGLTNLDGSAHTSDGVSTSAEAASSIARSASVLSFAGITSTIAQGSDDGRWMSLDVDGNGLSDAMSNGQLYCANQLVRSVPPPPPPPPPIPPPPVSGSFQPRSLSPFAGLTHNERRSWNLSGGLTGLITGNFDVTNRSADTAIMIDADGDGFPDHVEAQKGSFNVWINRRGQGFDKLPNPWVIPSLSAPPDPTQHQVVPIDTLVRWRAPFAGNVTFTAPIQKQAAGGDGVRAQIFFDGDTTPIWDHVIAGDDTSLCNPGPGNVCNGAGFTRSVQAGDRFYTKLSAQQNATADKVTWATQVVYDQPQNLLEPYGRPIYRFVEADDLRQVGRMVTPFVADSRGHVAITGTIFKQRTSDDVRVRIFKQDATRANSTTVLSLDLTGDQQGTIPTVVPDVAVESQDVLSFEVLSDVPIDPNLVTWDATTSYTTFCRRNPDDGTTTCGAPICSPPDAQGLTSCTIVGDPMPDAPLPGEIFTQKVPPFYPLFQWAPLTPTATVPIQVAGQVTIAGDAQATDVTTAPVFVLVQGVNKVYLKQTIQPGDLTPVSVSLSPTLAAGDQLFFTIYSDDPASAAMVAWSPKVNGAGAPVNVRYRDPAFRPDPSGVGVMDVMSGGFHQWSFGDWNGTQPFNEGLISLAVIQPGDDPSKSTFFPAQVSGGDSSSWLGRGASEAWHLAEQVPGLIPDEIKILVDDPVPGVRVAESGSKGFDVGSGLSVAYSTGDSKGKQDLIDMNGDHIPDYVTTGATALGTGTGFEPASAIGALPIGDGDLRVLDDRSLQLDLGASKGGSLGQSTDGEGQTVSYQVGIGAGLAYGVSRTRVDLVDVNGDGLPDQVEQPDPGSGDLHVRLNLGYRFSGDMVWTAPAWENRYASLLGNVVGTSLFTKFGDDLSANALNLQETASSHVGGDVSVGDEDFGLGAGTSRTLTVLRTQVALMDITGDGLPDQIMKKTDEDFIRVKINLGGKFENAERRVHVVGWPAGLSLAPDSFLNFGLGDADALAFSATPGSAGSKTISVNWYIFSFKKNWSNSSGTRRSTLDLEDVDGDGRLDHVVKIDGNQTVYARLNQIGPANLLKTVHRPLGGTVTLSYARAGNEVNDPAHVDMPQNQWVLSQVDTDDGRGQVYTNRFDYTTGGPDSAPPQNGSGFYDRIERESYGYRHVTTTRGVFNAQTGNFDHGDGSRLEQFFENGDYYRKGLLVAEYERDKSGLVIDGTRITYKDPAGVPFPRTGAFFPAETQRVTLFFEKTTTDINAAAPKSKTELRFFDPSGNLTELDDLGDDQTATNDQVMYRVSYVDEPNTHITRATSVEADVRLVTGAAGPMLRRRTAVYAPLVGTMTSLTNLVSGGRVPGSGTPGTAYNQASSVYGYTYDAFGNLLTFTDPTGYKLQYTYDTTAQTYRTRIDDKTFGYFSTASYDLHFGAVTQSNDVNNQPESFTYDAFGRLCTVRGPDDQTPTVAPTIAMSYGIVSGSCPNAPTPGLLSPAYAVTRHKDVQHTNDPIDTVTFIDGLRRVIQTKKDIDVDPTRTGTSATRMTVTGPVTFDGRGRVASQGQPVALASTTTTFESMVPTINPTLFAYDEIGRPTNVSLTDTSTMPPAVVFQTNTLYSIVTPSGLDNLGDGRTWLLTDVRDQAAPLPATTPPISNVGRRLTYADSRVNRVAVREFNQIGTATTLTALTTRYAYDPLDQLLSVTDAKGNVTSTVYDSVGQMVTLASPDAGQTEYRYDLAGNLKEKQTPVLRPQSKFIVYNYDHDRLTGITYPTTTGVTYTYGASTETGDGNGNVAGRIKKVTMEAGSETRLYDHLGNVKQTQTTLNNMSQSTPATVTFTMKYSYDWLGRMQDMTFPNWMDNNFVFVSGEGEKVSYFYDHGGNLDRITGLDQTKNPQQTSAPLSFTYLQHIGYDEFEQRTMLTSGNGIANKYFYEAPTRRLSQITASAFGTQEHQLGKPPTPFHKLQYTYDKAGNVTHSINDVSVQPWRNASVFVGPMDVTYGYDNTYQLRSMSGKYRPNVAYGYQWSSTYTYDEIGNIKTKANSQDRLVWDNQTVNTNDPSPVATQLLGSRFDHNVSALTYSLAYQYTGPRPHATNQITETLPVNTNVNRAYTYDANGNNTGNTFQGATRVQIWDEESRLKEVDRSGGTLAKLRYDDQGERRKKQTAAGDAWYVNQFFVLLPGNLPTKHIFAGETRLVSKTDAIFMQNPAVSYYHPDPLGTTSYTTSWSQNAANMNQDLLQHERYFAFGELWRPGAEQEECDLGRPDNLRREYTFTSKEWDVDTSLYYFGARYFDPHADVWQSPDPMLKRYIEGGSAATVFEPKNLGLYSYAWNNPVGLKDPSGGCVEDLCIVEGAAGAAVLILAGAIYYSQPKVKRDFAASTSEAARRLKELFWRTTLPIATTPPVLQSKSKAPRDEEEYDQKADEKKAAAAAAATAAAVANKGKPKPSRAGDREKGQRATEGTAEEAQDSLDEISEKQDVVRKGKADGIIDRISKSADRLSGRIKRIKSGKDVADEFPKK